MYLYLIAFLNASIHLIIIGLQYHNPLKWLSKDQYM